MKGVNRLDIDPHRLPLRINIDEQGVADGPKQARGKKQLEENKDIQFPLVINDFKDMMQHN